MPTIDLHKYWHTVRPLLQSPSLPLTNLQRFTISWLFIAVIVHSLYGSVRFLLLFPLVAGFEFVGQIFLVNGVLQAADMAGAVTAYLLWVLLLRWLPGRFTVVALAFAGMIVASRLQPFRFVAPGHSFGWIPFAGFMRGSITVAMQAFCTKFYQYGGLIWLLGRCGVALQIGTVATAMLAVCDQLCRVLAARALGGNHRCVHGVGHRRRVRPAARRGAGARPEAAGAAAAEHARFADAVLSQHGATPAPARPRRGKHAPYVPPHLRG